MAGDPSAKGGRAMTAVPILLNRQRDAQWRTVADTMAIGLPIVAVASALGWRLFGGAGVIALGLASLCALTIFAGVRARRLDRDWLIGALDASLPRFEDSSALLFRDRDALPGLLGLQRARIEGRIDEARSVDLRPAWSRRPILASWAAAAVLTATILIWPAAGSAARPVTDGQSAIMSAGAPAITAVRLRITPPAYTGLAIREQTALDASVPEGSRVEWIVDFTPQPTTASLEVPEARSTALVRDGTRWTGARLIDKPTLYRIAAEGLPRQRLHRIDAVADAAPVVQLIEPDRQLLLVTRGQTRWTPVFEVSDDYGVLDTATLKITVTKGDGENITFEQRSIPLSGTGEARRRRFSPTLDLAREGMAPGSDLIVQLVVSDNRNPERHIVGGPSVILRWPTDLGLADGLDGLAAPVLPVYFASQRQIIIDMEALIAERPRLDTARFVDRSDAIGNDQARLRTRYGQFMGGENEAGGSGGGIALPTNDAPPTPSLPTNDAPAPTRFERPDPHPDHEGHQEGDEPPAGIGHEEDVLHAFGHAHDEGDAATLFDPGTRSTLAQMLDAMFNSERALRQGRPEEALPFANIALELLKQAQQATRIFLRRTGSDLPPVDLSRRLTGKRDDIVAEDQPAPVRIPADTVVADAWRALDERATPGRTPPLALGTLDRWVRENRGRLSDPLALGAAIDTVRNEPGCLDCRRRLRALLWSALERPPVVVRRREAPNTRGERYLDAMR